MIRLYRLIPTRTMIVALIGLLSMLSVGVVRDFVWADLKVGMVDLRGLSSATRYLTWLGFALLFVMVGALFLSDFTRASSPLMPLQGGTPGRGTVMPLALLPVTSFILAVAWSFMLAGALHARRLIRFGTVGLYLFFALPWTGQISVGFAGAFETVFAWGMLLAVPVFFFVRWRARTRPAAEFLVLLAIVVLTFAVGQAQGVGAWRVSGIPNVFQSMEATIGDISFLVTPLLLFIGLDIAEFTYRASGWVAEIFHSRLPRLALWAALLIVILWRLYAVALEATDRVGENSFGGTLLAYIGALGVPLAVGLVWWTVFRGATPPTVEEMIETARKAAPPLVLVYLALPVVLFLMFVVVGIIALALNDLGPMAGLASLDSRLLGRATGLSVAAAGVVSLVAAIWFLRRGNRVPALYLGVLGAVVVWNQLAGSGGPLGVLTWNGAEPTIFWWVVIFVGFAAFWLWRGSLSIERARRLLFLLIVTALLGQTNFIEDPFSPFLGFSGITIIALGVIWDAFSFGPWANVDSPKLPRVSRIFLYLGYVLFGVAVVGWVVAVHDLALISDFTGGIAIGGFNLLGKPLLYAVFAITLALPPGEAEGTSSPNEPARRSEG